MEVKFKRTLFGYHPKTVEKALNSIYGETEQELKELEEQYSRGESDLQSLKAEIIELKNALAAIQVLEEELSKLLVPAYLTACTKVLDATEQAAQMEEEALHKIAEREKEKADLKAIIDDITIEVHAMTKRFSLALEGSNDE